MTQSSFQPSDEDIHHMIEHDTTLKKGNEAPKIKKIEVSWRTSSDNDSAPLKRTIVDDEKDAISPHFDS